MILVVWIVAQLVVGTLVVSSCGREPAATNLPAPPPEQAVQRKLAVPPNPASFGVQSDVQRLKATDIVFSSGLPLDKTKNTLWCSSMVMAWQEANAHFPQGKLALQNEPELTAQLNSAPPAKASLPEEWYYTGFGKLPDKTLLSRLTKELKVKFPDALMPQLPSYDPTLSGFLTLAYLRGGALFEPPYEQEPEGLTFPGLSGDPAKVASFGLGQNAERAPEAVRRHVKVLYSQANATKSGFGPVPGQPLEHCVVDLAADNPDIAVILALVEPAESLEATWHSVQQLAAGWEYRNNEAYALLSKVETLTVPVLVFDLEKLHATALVEPSSPKGAGAEFYLYQRVGFSLTASGALVASLAAGYPGGGTLARHFTFDRPFLIAMKLRKAEEPFFLMWVANAELMRKR